MNNPVAVGTSLEAKPQYPVGQAGQFRSKRILKQLNQRQKINAVSDSTAYRDMQAASEASPIMIAGQSAFDSIKNTSPKKDIQTTRLVIGSGGVSAVGDGEREGVASVMEAPPLAYPGENNSHSQSFDHSIRLLNHNFQNRNKVALHSHSVSKKASQCEMEPVTNNSQGYAHHGSMVNDACAKVVSNA